MIIQHIANQSKSNTRTEKIYKSRKKKKQLLWRHVSSKSPTASSCEIPILVTLHEKGSEFKLPARKVIEELTSTTRERWFKELREEDIQARYPSSRRKIVEITIRYARKNLELKEELYPPSNEHPGGSWEITTKGRMRLRDWMVRGEYSWIAKYSRHENAVIPVESADEEIQGQ